MVIQSPRGIEMLTYQVVAYGFGYGVKAWRTVTLPNGKVIHPYKGIVFTTPCLARAKGWVRDGK